MTEEEAFPAILEAVKTQVAWPSPAPPIVRENAAANKAAEFVCVYVNPEKSEQRSMGTKDGQSRSWTHKGIVLVAIHTKLGEGTKRARALVQALRDGLQGRKVSGVIFRDLNDVDKGASTSHYYVVVGLTFEYYEHK